MRRVNPPVSAPGAPTLSETLLLHASTRDLWMISASQLSIASEKNEGKMPCQETSKRSKRKIKSEFEEFEQTARYCRVTPKAPHLT